MFSLFFLFKTSCVILEKLKKYRIFSQIVQLQRSTYKDRTGTFHPLVFFTADEYEYQCAPGMTLSYIFKYPMNYIEYKIPTVLPLTYERRKQTPYIPDLSLTGLYGKKGCIAYKRWALTHRYCVNQVKCIISLNSVKMYIC